MVMRPAGTNASYSRQVFGEQSPVPAGLLSSGPTPRYVAVPPEQAPAWMGGHAAPQEGSIARAPAPQEGGWAGARGAIRITDTAPSKIRREIAPFERADWVPHVLERYPLLEVGTGRTKDQFCGTFKLMPGAIAGACRNNPDKHKPLAIPLGCTRRECPEDWVKWARRSGKRVSAILNGYFNQKYKNQKKLLPGEYGAYLSDQVVISPGRATVQRLVEDTEREISGPGVLVAQSNDFHKLFMRKYRRAVDEIVEMLGITGAIEIPHNIRLRSSKESDKADRSRDVNRYRAVLDCDGWEEKVKFSPHSHLITDGGFIPMTSDELYEKTGWIYRNLGEVTNAEGLVYYLMSHAPCIEGIQNDRRLGTLHPSRLAHMGTIKIEIYPKCPECIAEGLAPEYADYVVGIVAGADYERNNRGRKVLKSWLWEAVTMKPYRQSEKIKVYRILQPGERIDRTQEPKWLEYYTAEKWAEMQPDLKPRQWV